MGMIRRRLISRFALLGVLSFALGFSYNYYLPKVEAYLLKEVERQSRAHSPVKIAPASLKFHLVPLGIVLTDVRVEPEGQSARYFAPATLKTVGARLAILPLIRGKVRLSRLYVQDSELNLFLREDLFEKKPAQTELRFDFDRIYNLPIDEIALENVRVQAKLEPQNVVFRVDQLDLLVENRYRSLFVELNAPKTLVKPSGPVAPLDVQLELRTLIEAREAQISAFKLRANESFVVASGRVNGDFETGRLDNGAFDARAKMRLTDLNIWERIFFLNPRLPALLGFAETDLALEVRAGKAMHLSGELTAKDFKFDKFFIGGVDARFQSDLKSLKSERILVSNDAGAARLNNLKIDWREKPRVEAEVVAENVNLSRLLHHLHVKEAPVLLVASGKGVCAGVLQDPIAVECEATITAPRLRIDSGEPKHTTIVDTADLRIKGSGRLTDKDFAWKATGQLGKGSSGSSDGVVNFDTGFKANYRADRLLLSDIKNLANLKLEGEGVLSGRTEGTAKWGTIDMHVDAKDFWLEDYPLGSFNTEFSYKAAHLNFKNAVGQYGVSRYNGDVGVDLARDRIKISLAVPFADLRDVQAMFQRKVELPIQVQGTGTGQIEANGPFAFRHMSYQVKSSFFRGEIAKETFDGQKIQITKSSGLVDVKGQINPAGEIDAVAVARGLRLEQSENVVGLGLDLQGLADVTMLIRGQLPRPRIELNGRLS
ncbi:MAG TPA: hypothetical protein PKC28_14020, partial [Bdellovibrionales bacterium]|nr:hypothetical protein [Bdellovibrionales bacterium]